MADGREHRFRVTVTWTGNSGGGTRDSRSYQPSFAIEAEGKPSIAGSSDPAFRGDPSCWSPEDLLVASLSACHKLWYLHLCAAAGVVVTEYVDRAEGAMIEDKAKGGWFTRVVLRPRVTIAAGGDAEKAMVLHHVAHTKCFIANSVNFPVGVEPTIVTAA